MAFYCRPSSHKPPEEFIVYSLRGGHKSVLFFDKTFNLITGLSFITKGNLKTFGDLKFKDVILKNQAFEAAGHFESLEEIKRKYIDLVSRDYYAELKLYGNPVYLVIISNKIAKINPEEMNVNIQKLIAEVSHKERSYSRKTLNCCHTSTFALFGRKNELEDPQYDVFVDCKTLLSRCKDEQLLESFIDAFEVSKLLLPPQKIYSLKSEYAEEEDNESSFKLKNN